MHRAAMHRAAIESRPFDPHPAAVRFPAAVHASRAQRAAESAHPLTAPNVVEALRRRATLQPEAPALRFDGEAAAHGMSAPPEPRSYGDLVQEAARTSAILREFGLGSGDVIAVLLPLVPQSYPALLGALAVGIVHPIDPLLPAPQIAGQLRAGGAKALFALGPVPGMTHWEKVRHALRSAPAVDLVLQANAAEHGPDWLYQNGVVNYDSLLCGAPVQSVERPLEIDPHRTAVLAARNGRGDGASLARQSHAGLMRQLRTDNLMRGWTDGARLSLGHPLFHLPGSLGWALLPLAKGMDVVLQPVGPT